MSKIWAALGFQPVRKQVTGFKLKKGFFFQAQWDCASFHTTNSTILHNNFTQSHQSSILHGGTQDHKVVQSYVKDHDFD